MKIEKTIFHHVKESLPEVHQILQNAIAQIDTSSPTGLYAEYEPKKDDYIFSFRFNHINSNDSPICIYRYLILNIEEDPHGCNLYASYIYNKKRYLSIVGVAIAAMILSVCIAFYCIIKWGYAYAITTVLASVLLYLIFMIKHASIKNDLQPERVIDLYSHFIKQHLHVDKKEVRQ